MSVQWAILVIASILILGSLGLTTDVYSQVGDTTKMMNMTPVTSPAGSEAVTLTNQVDTMAEALAATVYYVDGATGSDSPCDLSRDDNPLLPFLSIQGAFDCIVTNHSVITGLGPFQITVLDSGTYLEEVLLNGLTTTTFDTLTISSDTGQMAVVDGGNTRGTGFDVRIDNIIIDGFLLQNFQAPQYGNGIQCDGNLNLEIRNNVIDSQSDFGVLLGFRYNDPVSLPCNNVWIHNNVIMNTNHEGADTNNQGDGIHLMAGSSGATVYNNVFYNYRSTGIFYMEDADETDSLIRNNIFYPTIPGSTGIELSDSGSQVGFSSDYNIFFDTGGVVSSVGFWNGGFQNDLVDWQGAPAFQDINGIDADPLFRTLGSDFHVQSTNGVWNGFDFSELSSFDSSAIDGGDPSSSFVNEPSPNGGRINIGAYGNTAEASLSAPLGGGGGGPPVGGTYLPLDTTSLLVAGAYTTASWMIPILVSAVGIGLAVFTLKRSR